VQSVWWEGVRGGVRQMSTMQIPHKIPYTPSGFRFGTVKLVYRKVPSQTTTATEMTQQVILKSLGYAMWVMVFIFFVTIGGAIAMLLGFGGT